MKTTLIFSLGIIFTILGPVIGVWFLLPFSLIWLFVTWLLTATDRKQPLFLFFLCLVGILTSVDGIFSNIIFWSVFYILIYAWFVYFPPNDRLISKILLGVISSLSWVVATTVKVVINFKFTSGFLVIAFDQWYWHLLIWLGLCLVSYFLHYYVVSTRRSS